jgi:hypothetical protein
VARLHTIVAVPVVEGDGIVEWSTVVVHFDGVDFPAVPASHVAMKASIDLVADRIRVQDRRRLERHAARAGERQMPRLSQEGLAVTLVVDVQGPRDGIAGDDRAPEELRPATPRMLDKLGAEGRRRRVDDRTDAEFRSARRRRRRGRGLGGRLLLRLSRRRCPFRDRGFRRRGFVLVVTLN